MKAYYTLSAPAIYDSLEVRRYNRSVFSIYGHIEESGFECIGDFHSFDAACEVAEKLGGKLIKKTS
jgi:hypothetical protein